MSFSSHLASDFIDSNGYIFPHSNPYFWFNLDNIKLTDWGGQFPSLSLQLKNINGNMNWMFMIDQNILYTWGEALHIWLYGVKMFENASSIYEMKEDSITHYKYTSRSLEFFLKELKRKEYELVNDLHFVDNLITIQSFIRGSFIRKRADLNALRMCNNLIYKFNQVAFIQRAIYIQKMWRGLRGRLKWEEYWAWDQFDKTHANMAIQIQKNWRRYSKRNELILRNALREIDKRLMWANLGSLYQSEKFISLRCSMNKKEASFIIHRAWKEFKKKKRNNFVKKHGLYNIFEKAVDMAMQKEENDLIHLEVAKNMQDLLDPEMKDWVITSL